MTQLSRTSHLKATMRHLPYGIARST